MTRVPGSPRAFDSAFRALWGGRDPFHWQRRLFDLLVQGRVPSVCNLPTGLGKTSVMALWLVALSFWRQSSRTLPRRLVYVVNRRTVVDQATDEAARLRRLFECPASSGVHEATLCLLRDALSALAGESGLVPLAVSTLRGEFADNGDWKENPARPAIIVGTVDMVGSKLLFSGYGDGRYGRAHHAGLVGQDALVVHDEAHLEPAFDELLTGIVEEQRRTAEPRPIRVMRLSATTRATGVQRDDGADADLSFGIEDEDRRDGVVSQRLGARKALTIVDTNGGTAVARIAGEALRLGAYPARVLVYVRSPEAVAHIADAIERELGDGGGTRIARLTGTLRGHERDQLAKGEVFRAFSSGADRSVPLPQSLYLVSTSAGEVGADWDADHLVCDLTTLDSMAQRFGRVNRLGGDGRSATITAVAEPIGEKSPFKTELEETARWLRSLPALDNGVDASPAALSQLLATPAAQRAFSPRPTILPTTNILFDAWSLTSITGEMPGRPEVAPYLHGVADWEPPDTHVAWRADIALLARRGGERDSGEGAPCSRDEIEQAFEAFPLRSAERLRDRTDRVQQELRVIAQRLRHGARARAAPPRAGHAESEASHDTGVASELAAAGGDNTPLGPNPWVVLVRAGAVRWVRLEDVAPEDHDDAKRAQPRLAFATVVLPTEAGGLEAGMLNGKEPPPRDARSLDVAELAVHAGPTRQRVVLKGDASRPLLGGAIAAGVNKASVTLATAAADAETERIEYRVAKGEDNEPGERVLLCQHNNAVSEGADRIGRALGLSDHAVTALRIAGRWHDAGKARSTWQRYANNPNGADPVAKSDRYGTWRQLAGYRHEFGSLHDAAAADEIRQLDAETRDLVLHLIAAHHGWARPHFEPRHFDPGDPSRIGGQPRSTAENERMAVDTIQRFGRLQRRCGRWALAWLESILRCVDAEASKSATHGDRGRPTSRIGDGIPGGRA
ncbi:MAG: type I-U CRISPR-associated helicase/endonuclease Cas3 [Phycisphaerales bacterium]